MSIIVLLLVFLIVLIFRGSIFSMEMSAACFLPYKFIVHVILCLSNLLTTCPSLSCIVYT